jgi:O-antigen/teichoic acid export membrane protein
LMSGNQRKLFQVQAVMSVVMLAMTLSLVPKWGILGAALASAITNVGINLWNLREVRARLGLSPYSKNYLRLIAPTILALASILAARMIFHTGAQWIVILIATLVAYVIFGLVSLLVGLDSDDRLILDAVLERGGFVFRQAKADVS